MGISRGQFIKLERGERKLTERTIALASRAFGVGKATVIADDEDLPPAFVEEMPLDVESTVKVVGYVGAGAEGHFYAVAQGELDEVPAPEGSTESTVALEIRGESLGAFFERWLVFYDDIRRPLTPDLIGKLCVVGLEDGRVLIKKVRRGKVPARFDLISQTEKPIENAAIEWAARVKNMVPR